MGILLVAGVLSCGGSGEDGASRGIPAQVPATMDHRIVVHMTDDMRFVPEHVVVTVGDTLVWVNEGAMPHTSTDEPGRAGVDEHNRLPPGATSWDSGPLESGGIFRLVVGAPGEYAYLCTFHEVAGMIGHLTVRPGRTPR